MVVRCSPMEMQSAANAKGLNSAFRPNCASCSCMEAYAQPQAERKLGCAGWGNLSIFFVMSCISTPECDWPARACSFQKPSKLHALSLNPLARLQQREPKMFADGRGWGELFTRSRLTKLTQSPPSRFGGAGAWFGIEITLNNKCTRVAAPIGLTRSEPDRTIGAEVIGGVVQAPESRSAKTSGLPSACGH
jgi:hypothetical protein